jgi:hypothetical protein
MQFKRILDNTPEKNSMKADDLGVINWGIQHYLQGYEGNVGRWFRRQYSFVDSISFH